MTEHGRLAAVLFDMDGTLLDSEKLWAVALQELAARHSGALPASALAEMTGRAAVDSMRVFYEHLGVTGADPEADNRFLAERMAGLFATEVTWRPGAAALIARVRGAGLPTALVTSTARRLVEVALDSMLGRDTFDAVVCGDEVAATKPDPESYRTAAARLGVPIAQCVAIEDSPTGLASARAAGAAVVGVRGDVPLADIDGVPVVASLTDLDLPYLAGLVR